MQYNIGAAIGLRLLFKKDNSNNEFGENVICLHYSLGDG